MAEPLCWTPRQIANDITIPQLVALWFGETAGATRIQQSGPITSQVAESQVLDNMTTVDLDLEKRVQEFLARHRGGRR